MLKYLLYHNVILGAYTDEWYIEFGSESLSFLFVDLRLVYQIYLRLYQHHRYFFSTLVMNSVTPAPHSFKAFSIISCEGKDAGRSAPIVTSREGIEFFLSGCIPNMKRYLLTIDEHLLLKVIDAECLLVVHRKFILDEPCD